MLATGTALLPTAQLRAQRVAAQHATGPYELTGCPSHTFWRDATFPTELEPDRPSFVFWLRALLSPAEAHALIAIAEKHSFSEEPDSTDLLPSHELYLLQRGRPAVEPVWAAIGERVERCVLPFVRTKFGCPNCVPCVSMVRRYKASERLRVTTHRDIESSVTMVVELRPAGATPEAGGLYIASSQEGETSFPTLRAGDAFIHDFGLLHGVRVACDGADADCARYSLVLWFQEDAAKCAAGGEVAAAERLLRRSAEAGVAEGRFSWARFVSSRHWPPEQGRPPTEAADASALADARGFLEAAAAQQNHSRSAMLLAQLLLDGVPPALAADAGEAARWARKAEELGHPQAAEWRGMHAERLEEGGGGARVAAAVAAAVLCAAVVAWVAAGGRVAPKREGKGSKPQHFRKKKAS